MIQARKALLALAAALATTAGLSGGAHAGGPTLADLQARQAMGTDQLVLKFRAGLVANLAEPALRDAAGRYGVQLIGSRRGSTGQIVKLDKRLPNAVAQKLAEDMKAAHPGLESAQADAWATIHGVPNDTLFASQWHYTEAAGGINLLNGWKRSKGKGVVVAVLDTGFRPHADLVANLLPGYDMIINTAVSNDGDGRDSDASDPGDGCGQASTWHGTHVAGTIAATTNNGMGVAGVAPKAKVQP
ncbi:S8 family serine peptidase, partial [Ideonella sp.]|uniref:S8 family serine peptidase n=1 Tax=Ideonella sp. TaxID=1929293 RepID=UPI003BB4F4B3